MNDGARALVKDLKKFLSSREEDELIVAACSRSVVPSEEKTEAISSETISPEQDHLTIEFAREKSSGEIVSSSVKENITDVPFTLQTQPIPRQENKVMTAEQKQAQLDQIAQEINACRRCPLGATRLHAVPGEGNPAAELMFIGEGPGFDEDHQGRPFIGRAGQLLDKMIAAMGLKREQVFIANIAKCHPMINPDTPQAHGNDRAPNAEEIAFCRKYLERQIAVISPKYIVALGGVASKALISDTKSLGALRGRFHQLHLDTVKLDIPIKILATYHPAALLRNPNWKKDAWADLQMVMAEMGLKRPQA